MKRRTALAATLGVLCRAAGPAAIVGASTINCSIAAEADSGNALLPGELRKLFDLAEDKMDIGEAALTIAREIYPGLDVRAYGSKIDVIARDAERYMADKPRLTHIDILRAFNTYLFQIYGMRYDHSAGARSDQRNYFLNGLLDTRTGMCLTMPMLYLAVGRRLGYPLYPVMVPQHMFLRLVLRGREPHNIEVTSGGGVLKDEEYAKKFAVPPNGIQSGAYIRTISLREFLAAILLQNALVLYPRGRRRAALAYFNKANDLAPRDPVYLKYLGMYWSNAAKEALGQGSPEFAQRLFQKSDAYHRAADDLGFTEGPYSGGKA